MSLPIFENFRRVMRRPGSMLLPHVGIDVRRSGLVDGRWYSATYQLASDLDPAEHFIAQGLAEGKSPNRWMDPAWYYAAYRDVHLAGANAVIHYLEHGWQEGRDPGPWFSTNAYLSGDPDAVASAHPFLHFLKLDAAPRKVGSRATARLLVRDEERDTAVVVAWRACLKNYGFEIDVDPPASRGWRDRLKAAFRGSDPRPNSSDYEIILSINGAGLDAPAVQALGESLILVSQDARAARKLVERLGASLVAASSATSSKGVAAVMHGFANGSASSWYPEPLLPAYMVNELKERRIDIAWRPRSSARNLGAAKLQIDELVARLSMYDFRIFMDGRQKGASHAAERVSHHVELRADWGAISCLQHIYGAARLALIMPEADCGAEVTADTLAALGAGALPILSYDACGELLDLLGQDAPIPMYKSFEELEAIVSHYLGSESERLAHVAEGRRRALVLPTYATRIGELIRNLGLTAPRLRSI